MYYESRKRMIYSRLLTSSTGSGRIHVILMAAQDECIVSISLMSDLLVIVTFNFRWLIPASLTTMVTLICADMCTATPVCF